MSAPSTPLLLGAAAAAGAGLALQATINARLRDYIAEPMLAALASFGVGTIALALLSVVVLATGGARPEMSRLAGAPLWVWLGGLLGAYYIFTTVTVTPRIGPALFLGLVVAGQLGVAVALEHFGAMGLERHPVSAGRVAGAALLVLGVILIRRF
ncbi:MAG TPA: DMT family transporter [Gemmatimonadaceae bacterium]|nr:DMT family transporter [Gemmatimonadaceae bacterium]